MRKALLQLIFIMILILLWVLNPIPFSFVSSEQRLNFGLIEKADIRLLKNEIVALKLSPKRNLFNTTFGNPINSFESSTYEIKEVSSKGKKSYFSFNRYQN